MYGMQVGAVVFGIAVLLVFVYWTYAYIRRRRGQNPREHREDRDHGG
jgi:uncharacterized protein (DUF2062 family)